MFFINVPYRFIISNIDNVLTSNSKKIPTDRHSVKGWGGGKGFLYQFYCSVGHLDKLHKYFEKTKNSLKVYGL